MATAYERLRDYAGDNEDDEAIVWLDDLVAAARKVEGSWEANFLDEAVNELTGLLPGDS